MDIKQKLFKEDNIFQGHFIKVNEQTLETNNQQIKREIVDKCGAVGIVVTDVDNSVLLTKQYRPGMNDISIEIPAGLVDEGETALQAANRELLEETGHCAKLTEFRSFYTSPGMTNEQIILFKNTTSPKKVEIQNLDDDEFLNWFWEDIDVVKTMLSDGRIKDAKTIIALNDVLNSKC